MESTERYVIRLEIHTFHLFQNFRIILLDIQQVLYLFLLCVPQAPANGTVRFLNRTVLDKRGGAEGTEAAGPAGTAGRTVCLLKKITVHLPDGGTVDARVHLTDRHGEIRPFAEMQVAVCVKQQIGTPDIA